MNSIKSNTRQLIADEMILNNIQYYGNKTEPDFLGRLFDLKNLPSRDGRFKNAYDDIYQHMVNNTDWDDNWIYTDPRINLLHCEDELYLNFLATTLHPVILKNDEEAPKLLEIYNKYLPDSGFEIAKTGEMSGKPTYSGMKRIIGQAQLEAKKAEIKRFLNTDYVNGKINIMNDAIHNNTDIAIGTAKELLETVCKSILIQKGVPIDSEWTLPQLLKVTTGT